jgi:hypothetical protein
MNKKNKLLETFEKPNIFKFGDLIKNKQIDILYPDKLKLKAAVDKDIAAINKKIAKIAHNLELTHDLEIIKCDLNKINKCFERILKNIKKTWTNKKIGEDEFRVSDIIYLIEYECGYNEFEQVEDVFKFVEKHMKHTINYLSKFGCISCIAGGDLESWQNHPWSKEIYDKVKRAEKI